MSNYDWSARQGGKKNNFKSKSMYAIIKMLSKRRKALMKTEELKLKYPSGFELAVHMTEEEVEQHIRF